MTDYDARKDAAESYDAALKAIRMAKIKAYEQPDFFIEQAKQPEPQQEDMGL